MNSKRLYVIIALAGLLLMVASTEVFADVRPALQIEQTRSALSPYQDVNAAAASGYIQFLTCQISSRGAVGVPFVNEKFLNDAVLDPLHPEALLYQPDDRKLKLVGVAYIVMADAWWRTGHTRPPELFGQTFTLTGTPNVLGLPPYYALNAWLWKANPSGQFYPWNLNVPCPWPAREPAGTAG
jgi:hypothetical protein